MCILILKEGKHNVSPSCDIMRCSLTYYAFHLPISALHIAGMIPECKNVISQATTSWFDLNKVPDSEEQYLPPQDLGSSSDQHTTPSVAMGNIMDQQIGTEEEPMAEILCSFQSNLYSPSISDSSANFEWELWRRTNTAGALSRYHPQKM
jgi:hypothetical protein